MELVAVEGAIMPRTFVWHGRRHRVTELVDGWRHGGRWWLDEAPRDCFLVTCGRLTAELHHEDRTGGVWWLARVSD